MALILLSLGNVDWDRSWGLVPGLYVCVTVCVGVCVAVREVFVYCLLKALNFEIYY